MMGLPDGHVTAVPGLSRNAMLKALGNGVCPQQAELALRYLLTGEWVAVGETSVLLGTPRIEMGSMTSRPNARLETDIGQQLLAVDADGAA